MDSYLGPAALVSLLWNGLRIRVVTYRDVSRDDRATRLCLAVAVLGGAATGLGPGSSLGLVTPFAVVLYVLVTLVGVLLESGIVWSAARVGLRPDARFGEVLRPLAVATAPRVIYSLVALDPNLWWAEPIGSVWLLVAFVVAVEAALRRGFALAIGAALLVGILRWGLFAAVMRI